MATCDDGGGEEHGENGSRHVLVALIEWKRNGLAMLITHDVRQFETCRQYASRLTPVDTLISYE